MNQGTAALRESARWKKNKGVDYSAGHWTIQTAFLDSFSKSKRPRQPPFFIDWDGRQVTTGDSFPVPTRARVRVELLRRVQGVRQGVDIKMSGGVILANGELVPVLRTWWDEGLETTVEYPYSSTDGLMRVWNVYEMPLANGAVREDKWTGNAGMWIEQRSSLDRTYHCSAGPAETPNFEMLVFRLVVSQ